MENDDAVTSISTKSYVQHVTQHITILKNIVRQANKKDQHLTLATITSHNIFVPDQQWRI